MAVKRKKKLPVTLPPELDNSLHGLREKEFHAMTQTELILMLLRRGLAEAERKKDGAQDDRTA